MFSILIVLFSGCSLEQTNSNDKTSENMESGFYQLYYNCDCEINFAPERFYDELYILEINFLGVNMVIRLYGCSEYYILQVFRFEYKINERNRFSLHQKGLEKKQVTNLIKQIKYLRNLPKDVNPNDNKIDTNLFSLNIKNKKDTISVNGIVEQARKNDYGKIIPNKEKEIAMSFVCKFLRLAGIKYGDKKYSLVEKINDKIIFAVYVGNGFLAKNISYFIDGQKINRNSIGQYKFELNEKDTANLIHRIKVIETQWDGEIIEY